MTKRLLIIACLVALPTLVLGGLVATNELAVTQAQKWRVKITGFDPRDLLYGHYLSFRFDWNQKNEQGASCSAGSNCCLCLEPLASSGTDPYPEVSYKNCAEAAQCSSHILTTGDSSSPSGILNPIAAQKYFIPEKSAPDLDRILRNGAQKMSVEVLASKNGHYAFGKLFINDIPWQDWLKQQP